VLDRNQHANELAAPARLEREEIATRDFVLTAFVRITDPRAPLDLYIEGDGLAWLSRNEPSLDPTPRTATGLALAAADPAPNVAYLARPCQFTAMSMNPRCGIPYWTSKRFSPEVVASMDEAANRVMARLPGQQLNLIGYSGGGAIAVLLAARRADVRSLRTVAGNLDDEYVNELHHVSPMVESLNPIDVAARVASIPQIHFSGAEDDVVPSEVAQRFADKVGSRCAQVHVIPGMTHGGDWQQNWPALIAIEPACRDGERGVRSPLERPRSITSTTP
jgi:dienelactone hydrolase